jgi:hypothetical protein
MNRDELAALVRGTAAVAIGAALLWAIGHWLGWWVVAGIAVGAVADSAWCASRLPARWRPW